MKMNPLKDKEKRRIYWHLKNKRLTMHERMVERMLVKYFNDQKERILSNLPVIRSKIAVEQIFNREEEARLLRSVAFPALAEVMRSEAGEVGGRFGREVAFSAEMNSWLSDRTRFFSERINKTTYDQLSRELTAGIAEGEDFNQIADRMGGKVDEISKGRARTITTTETHSAQQKAGFEAYREVGVPEKTWVATFMNTRDWHIDLDGETVPTDKPFSNGLMFPGDTRGAPEEVINCQCQS